MDIKYDVTVKGITTKWDGNGLTGSQIEVAVCECILHHENDAKWNFPTPKSVSLFIKNTKDLPKPKRADLLTPGAQVKLRVRASADAYEVEVLSAMVQKSTPALDFLRSTSNVGDNPRSKGKRRKIF